MKEVIRATVDDRHFFEVAEHFAGNIVVGFARLNGRPVGVVANQPAVLAGVLDIDASREGGALRALLRRFNIPLLTLRRRARVPARHRPGVGRHHQARREAALRVRRGDGPEGHGHHAQGLRRRVRRHGVEAHPRRRQPRLPDRRDRGDGPGGRGQHRLPQGAPGREGPGRGARAARRGVPRQVREPVQGGGARLHRRGDPAGGHAPQGHPRVRDAPDKRQENPPKKHGNIPL